MNTEEFEKLVEKLRETLVDEPTTNTVSRSDFIVRASEGKCETFINILDALPGTLLRIGGVYYFRLYEEWVAPQSYNPTFDDYTVATMCQTVVENGGRVDLLNWPEE